MNNKQTTDDLIRELSQRPTPNPFNPTAMAAGMLVLMVFGLGLYLGVFGLRPDLAVAWQHLSVQAKTALPVALSALAIWLVLQSARPEGQVPLWFLAGPAALAFAMFLYRLAVADGPWLLEAVGQSALACLASIIMLSAAPLAAGVYFLRRAAPTRPVMTGALLGIATGAAITAGYAFHCTEDSPLFYVTWYGLAITFVAASGAYLGHRFLQW